MIIRKQRSFFFKSRKQNLSLTSFTSLSIISFNRGKASNKKYSQLKNEKLSQFSTIVVDSVFYCCSYKRLLYMPVRDFKITEINYLKRNIYLILRCKKQKEIEDEWREIKS